MQIIENPSDDRDSSEGFSFGEFMIPFCNNPKCSLHSNLVYDDNGLQPIRICAGKGDKIYWHKEVARIEYKAFNTYSSTQRFYLCEVCHNAVEMCK